MAPTAGRMAPTGSYPASGPRSSSVRRRLIAPLVLTGVLSALVLALGPGPGVTLDEYALQAQVDALDEGSWLRPHPYPTVDPEMTAYPDHLAVRTDSGFAAYPKHPLIPVVLLWSRRVVGDLGPWFVVLAGQVAAATAIRRLISQVAPRWACPGFWLAGLGSPLLLHAFVLWMHGWGIALAAVATGRALAVVSPCGASASRRWATVLLVLVVALLPLVRTEGVLFGGALSGALLIEARRRRCRRTLSVAVLVAGATVLARLFESAWIRAAVGPIRASGTDPSAHLSWAEGRVSAVVFNLLFPGYSASRLAMQGIATILLLAAAWWSRRRARGSFVAAFALCGAALHIVALHVPSASPVPGLVPGLPLLLVPLLLPRTTHDRSEGLLIPLAVLLLAGVAATAYPAGGGMDWGGR